MAKYKIEVSKSAEKALYKLPKQILPRLIAAIENLSSNPHPAGSRKLSGTLNSYRIRFNVYRIIYDVYDDIVLIKILKIGHRKDVYR